MGTLTVSYHQKMGGLYVKKMMVKSNLKSKTITLKKCLGAMKITSYVPQCQGGTYSVRTEYVSSRETLFRLKTVMCLIRVALIQLTKFVSPLKIKGTNSSSQPKFPTM